MAHIFYLDWNVHQLFGWERQKSDLVIDAIIRGIEAGDDFPPVYVYPAGEQGFYISPWLENLPGWADGGHNRAVGHYIMRKPLKCALLKGRPFFDQMRVPIPEVIIGEDLGEYQDKKSRFQNYR